MLTKLPTSVTNKALNTYSGGIPILVNARAMILICAITKKNRMKKKKRIMNKNVKGLKNISLSCYPDLEANKINNLLSGKNSIISAPIFL